jgi:hypothetical protein
VDWTALAGSMQRAITGSVLAEPVTFTRTPESGAPTVVRVRGIYQRPPIEASDGGVTYKGAEHRVTVRDADLPSWVEREVSGADVTITVRDIVLHVVDLYPDGQGLTSIECRR